MTIVFEDRGRKIVGLGAVCALDGPCDVEDGEEEEGGLG